MGIQLVQPGQHAEQSVAFEDFWALYPRKVARKDAAKAWNKLRDEQRLQAVIAMADWRKIFLDRNPEHIPHAATWLNGERWDDELPRAAVYNPPAPKERAAQIQKTEMPQHVRDMIARMRK